MDLPKGRLIAVTGVSGSGKTTLILESLIPALEAHIAGQKLPPHVRSVQADGIARVRLIDSAPIGINVRSTVATYADIHDELRKVYARTPEAKAHGYKAGIFLTTLAAALPDLRWHRFHQPGRTVFAGCGDPPPGLRRSRYGREAGCICRTPKKGGTACTLPQLMAMSIDEALQACADLPLVARRLQVLQELGLGYLTLGEQTPSLSGGEAQRLKLASEMGRGQSDAVFVFDEPTIGLHPLNVETLLRVFRRLTDNGATVVVIEHDQDVIRNADYILDMGPGGGVRGGRIVASGTPEQLTQCEASLTGRCLRSSQNKEKGENTSHDL